MYKGKSFRLGHYPYSEDGDVQAIEWLVLDERDDGTAIAITRNDIDSRKYNDTLIDITWEKCDLRKWLNDDFLDRAFTAEERTFLRKVRIDNPNSDEYGTDGGNSTEDRVFCLSTEELYRYFAVNTAMRTVRTPYSRMATGKRLIYDHWWLRTPGETQDRAACVCSRCEGRSMEAPYEGGWVVDCSNVREDLGEDVPEILGIRPVICVDLTNASSCIVVDEQADDVKRSNYKNYHPMELFVRKRIEDGGSFDLEGGVYGRPGSITRALKSKVTRGVPLVDGTGTCSPYAVMLIIYGCLDTYTYQGSSKWSNTEAAAYDENPKDLSWYREIYVSEDARVVASWLNREALSIYLEELCFDKKMNAAIPALGAFGNQAAIERIIAIAKKTSAKNNTDRKNIYVARGALLHSDEQIAKDYVEKTGLREVADSNAKKDDHISLFF